MKTRRGLLGAGLGLAALAAVRQEPIRFTIAPHQAVLDRSGEVRDVWLWTAQRGRKVASVITVTHPDDFSPALREPFLDHLVRCVS